MCERFKGRIVDVLDAVFDFLFGSDEGQTRMLFLYVVMFLACLAGTVHAVYRAVSCFPGETFWADVVFAVWFGVLAVVMYVSLLALSECFTWDKERSWRERDYE